MKKVLFWITILLICISLVLESSKSSKGEQLMEAGNLSNDLLEDPIVFSVARALKVANSKAKEVGFNLDELSVSITQEDDWWIIGYGPKNKSALGGTLVIKVNRTTGKIEDIEQGQ